MKWALAWCFFLCVPAAAQAGPTPVPTCVWSDCYITGAGIITSVAGNGTSAFIDSYGQPALGAYLDESGRLSGVTADLWTSNFYLSFPDTYYGEGMVNAASGLLENVGGTWNMCGDTGDGGLGVNAELCNTGQTALDLLGNLYIPDEQFHVVRMVSSAGVISTFAGMNGAAGYAGDGGQAASAELNTPSAVAVNETTGDVYIADQGNNVVRKVNPAGVISTVAGVAGAGGFSGNGGPALLAELSLAGGGFGIDGGDVCVSGNTLYIVDTGNSCVRAVNLGSGTITQVAGTGTSNGFSGDGGAATSAQLAYPQSMAVDNSGQILIADTNNQRIRGVNPSTGIITTISGSAIAIPNGMPQFGDGGPASAAEFFHPTSISINRCTGALYIADSYNWAIRMIAPVCPLTTPTPSDTPTSAPTGTPSRTPTRTPSRTPTATPSASPSAVPPTPAATATPPATSTLSLTAAYPNPDPSRGPVWLPYVLTCDAAVDIRIYDVAGETVRDLAPFAGLAGENEEEWDGRNSAGSPASSGVYIGHIMAQAQGQKQDTWVKMAIVR